ncbi:hypothetical protein NHX12_026700 [Muraenolepis orangiensis]|uniref:Uncharacterized protein n=1 Tax=Muraenolepis orangiensis TaxID=630683 RepID=A0A9Q0EMV3_9TELE|nr:hypothetical protein NHX12_026700 [Muraenolepis orangiensis]
MAGLFQRIGDRYPDVAVQLKEANFHSDDVIRTLSREDLHELLPGPGKLRQRKAVYELIHQQVHQQEPTQEANQGAVYHQYQLPAVGPSPGDVSGIKPAPHSRGVDPDESSRARDAQPAAEVQSSVTTQQTKMPTVKFMSIVSGKTLDSEKTLLDRVRYMGNITLVEDSSDPQLIVVFCPITSRIESNLESVMAKRPASLCDKPILLVMMYHTHKPKAGVILMPGSVLKRWNIVLHVNVFYHETVHGLVPCDMNIQAVTEMHATLLKHCSE